jgi:hypothetical protein
MVVVAAVPHRTPSGEHGEVGDRLVGSGAVQAERADRYPDQRRVSGRGLDVAKRAIAHWPGPRNCNVGACDQALQRNYPLRGIEIDGHRALSGISAPPPQAGVGPSNIERKRWPRPVGRSGRRFNDDHVGAEFGEYPPTNGRELVADLDDASSG